MVVGLGNMNMGCSFCISCCAYDYETINTSKLSCY